MVKRRSCCNKWLEKVFLDWRHPGRRRVLGWERRQAENWRTKLGRLRLAWLPNHLKPIHSSDLQISTMGPSREQKGDEKRRMVWIVLLITILFGHREVLLREVMPATMGAFRPASTSQLAIPHLKRGRGGEEPKYSHKYHWQRKQPKTPVALSCHPCLLQGSCQLHEHQFKYSKNTFLAMRNA